MWKLEPQDLVIRESYFVHDRLEISWPWILLNANSLEALSLFEMSCTHSLLAYHGWLNAQPGVSMLAVEHLSMSV